MSARSDVALRSTMFILSHVIKAKNDVTICHPLFAFASVERAGGGVTSRGGVAAGASDMVYQDGPGLADG